MSDCPFVAHFQNWQLALSCAANLQQPINIYSLFKGIENTQCGSEWIQAILVIKKQETQKNNAFKLIALILIFSNNQMREYSEGL